MRRAWALRLALAASGLACSSFGRAAQAEPNQVLCVAQQRTLFSERVCAEIESMGFRIVPAQTMGEPGLPKVVAAVRIFETPRPRSVELWVADGADGQLELSGVVQPSPSDDEASQAVRASEQLRAFFQPLREPTPVPAPPLQKPVTPPSAPPDSVAPRTATPPRAQPVHTPSPPRFVGELSLAVPLDPSGAGVDASFQGRWLVARRVGIGGVLGLPIQGSRVRSGVNSASLSAVLLGSEVSLALLESPALRVTTHAGLALAWLRTKGRASTPYTSQSDSAIVALPLLGAELAPRLSERIRLCVGARAGVALPKAELAFAGRRVTSWGWPLVLLSAGVSVDF